MTTAPIAPAAGQSDAIVDYLDAIEPASVDLMSKVTRATIKRTLVGERLGFTDAETLQLTNHYATVLATSDLIGRSVIQAQVDVELANHQGYYESFNEQESELLNWTTEQLRALFTPRTALAFFRKIVNFPMREGAEFYSTIMEGRAFSLAATSDRIIMDKIARVIEERIETGKDIRGAGRVIEEILDATGIAHTNGYGALVARTNTMEAYRGGHWSRFSDTDLDGLMPIWRYVGIKDGRQRGADREKAKENPELPDHFAKTGKYHARSVSFFDVRGNTAKDVINCRCSFRGITRRQWARLQADGARLESPTIPSWS